MDDWNAVITEVEPREPLPGPLYGKRLIVKDLIDTAGIRTTYGSKIYSEHVPTRTAPAVERLVAAGAVVVGKANLHEFAWGVTSQNPWYGTVENPRHPGKTTGGSSGGNAAALAAGLCDLGLGTDTGGSIRLPSACCDLVGLKPSLGRTPTEGVFPLCPSFDTLGPMARTVEEVALAWSVLAAAPVPEPRLAGLTLGLLTTPPSVGGPALPENRAAEQYVERLEQLGARVVAATIPSRPTTRGPCSSTRLPSRIARRSRSARPTTATTCARSSSTHRPSSPRRWRGREAPFGGGANTYRPSTSTSRRCSGSTCRRSTATSSRCASR
jgi:Asp-tRNA(Asn)/Glu-tRNA(Gln) amidotransferase A subunit family amidase